MNPKSLTGKHRLTEKEKLYNDRQWYKDRANDLDKVNLSNSMFRDENSLSDKERYQVNYDLFNNSVKMSDFNYVCQPFGDEVGELPANFTNRDIVSGKIKVLLGMEMKMPFSWKVLAVNEEATTRKEEEEFNRHRDYVVAQVMKPIRIKQEKEAAQQSKGRELSPEEKQQIEQQIEQRIEELTPDKVRQYMSREHQDPAEALNRQLLQYLLPEKRIAHKFNKGWKHTTLTAGEVYWVGELNGEPDVEVVNMKHFNCDKSPDLDFVEDGEWAMQEIRMTPSQVVAKFGSELTEEEIDKIYSYHSDTSRFADADFTFTGDSDDTYTVSVRHFNWKALKQIKYLTYLDDNDEPQMMVVDENYRLNEEAGDIKLEKDWIPFSYECYKIMSDIYVHCRPVPGQNKDLDNLWECKLSYYGAFCDGLNSVPTSPMDRMKGYQYLYNIIIYRIELLMASDKGKILAANINAIPKSAGIDTNKFHYFMEANKMAWFNPMEEGNRANNGDIGSVVKEIDMSLVSDIQKYMQMAEYVERRCGASIGVTPQMEAQIASGEAVTNTQQSLVQSSYIIQPYFELHNTVKANVLNAFLNVARVAYSKKQPKKLSYILDDLSLHLLKTDPQLLEDSKCVVYVANSTKAHDAKKAVENLAQAALQNQQIDLADIIKVIKSDSINEAEELLDAAQGRKNGQLQQIEKAKIQAQKDQLALEDEKAQKEHEREKERIVLKETERRETELQKQAMLSMGFNEDKDLDNDGTPDVLEVAKFGVDAQIKNRKLSLDADKIRLEKEKFAHQQEQDKVNNELDKEKNEISRIKKKTSS